MSVDEFNTLYLSPLLETVSKEKKMLILLGDFNINLLNCNLDKSVENFLDITSSFSLLPHITLPTRITNSSSTLIDNIFSNTPNFDNMSGNICTAISDHMPQFLIFQKKAVICPPENDAMVRDWKKLDHENFILKIIDTNWEQALEIESDDVNISFDKFINRLDGLLDQHVPTRLLTRRQKKRDSNPWITKGIIKSIQQRDRLYKSLIKAKDPLIKSALNDQYKQYRNLIVSLCRRSKKMFYASYFNNNLVNIYKVWKGINSIISTKQSKPSFPNCLNLDNGD
ncbi:uncharacterized protein LOC130614615 [Hydractinia symbiolongicarpus]|uniref:uncharacterized protein LOC130614615 n=1 Tax=Hydractinia symbiolongicarpus TaxID=13093 RepID=UPI00254BC61D|nr:uncharacterized protein LOC130614615 [Hydractinia symbiolongicarpus]